MSMCKVVSCVVKKVFLLWPLCSLGRILLAFVLLHFFYPRPNLPVTPSISWLPTFAFQSPVMKIIYIYIYTHTHIYIFFLRLVPKGLIGLHRTGQPQLLQDQWLGIDLDYCDVEWCAWKLTKIILSILRLHPSILAWKIPWTEDPGRYSP